MVVNQVKQWVTQLQREHRGAIWGVIIFVLLASLLTILLNLRGGPAGVPIDSRQYFLDLTTGEFVERPLHTLTPHVPAEGRIEVRAQIYSCSSCDDRSTWFGHLLMDYTDRPQEKPEALESSRMVASYPPEGAEGGANAYHWFPEASREGRGVTSESFTRCPDQVDVCTPGTR